MTAQRSSEASSVVDATRRTSRRCGDCQLCCKLIPVEEFGKRANERCRHQRAGKGCAIYAQRPFSCALWNCRWLVDSDALDLPRPDRAHYRFRHPDRRRERPADQHSRHPSLGRSRLSESHRAPSFRAWLDRQSRCALIRYGSSDGLLLAPPSITGGSWRELQSNATPRSPHSLDEIATVMGEGSEQKLMSDFLADIERIERDPAKES